MNLKTEKYVFNVLLTSENHMINKQVENNITLNKTNPVE